MSTVISGDLADSVDRDFLDHSPLPALECRTLRHMWPRMGRANRNARKLPTNDGTTWKIAGAVDAGRLLERRMICQGGCGTVRIEMFCVLRDGRMVRDGYPRYIYATGYLRKRDDDHDRLDPLGQDQIMGALVRRLYPKLRW